MISEQQLVEKWRKLAPAKQQQVWNFVEHLESQAINNQECIAPLPTIELWSPCASDAVAQDLLKLLAADPGEDLA